MAYWLMKSEPAVYSWEQMAGDKKTVWSGVRNHQAANNMKAMKPGDRAFFYHSNDGREIAGIVKVSRPYHSDPTDTSGKFGMVEVTAEKPLKKPVALAEIKAQPQLRNMALVRQSRLSVSPVTAAEWVAICKMGGIQP
ncbi:MAG: EVE domain-containing protein [Alphaproteobacteria bacterium]|nr:EVE domain-containing protein [Alphaproteobacteria bacterium]